MASANIVPRNQEREFHAHELFFSTTDLKGIILSGNDVFRRVSGYTEEELIGQPHNIIRHPDMPRCVFSVLWQYIQSGQPISAYVKNMAHDGCYYWVVTLVIPIPGRYLSIRFKPSSKFFPIVQPVYQEILALEKSLEEGGMSKQEAIGSSTAALLKKIESLGFPDYNAFMHAMLAEELKSREQLIAGTEDPQQGPANPSSGSQSEPDDGLDAFLSDCLSTRARLNEQFLENDGYIAFKDKLGARSSSLLRLCQTTRMLSLNAQVESSRLGEAGESLGVVAQRMGENSQESASSITQITESITLLVRQLKEIIFGLSAGKLEVEMLTSFLREVIARRGESVQMEREIDNISVLLDGLGASWRTVAPCFDSLRGHVGGACGRLRDLDRFRQVLEFIHSIGQVEAARSSERHAFDVILHEVRQHIGRTKEEIADFESALTVLKGSIGKSRLAQTDVSAGIRRMSQRVASLARMPTASPSLIPALADAHELMPV